MSARTLTLTLTAAEAAALLSVCGYVGAGEEWQEAAGRYAVAALDRAERKLAAARAQLNTPRHPTTQKVTP